MECGALALAETPSLRPADNVCQFGINQIQIVLINLFEIVIHRMSVHDECSTTGKHRREH